MSREFISVPKGGKSHFVDDQFCGLALHGLGITLSLFGPGPKQKNKEDEIRGHPHGSLFVAGIRLRLALLKNLPNQAKRAQEQGAPDPLQNVYKGYQKIKRRVGR